MRRWTWIRLGWAVGLAGAVMACGRSDDYNSGPVTGGLVAAKASPSGDAQSGTVGQELANPLRVVVTRAGVPESGAMVTWRTAATGAAFTPAVSVTDNSGIATTQWSLGQTAGAETAQADLAGGGGVTFSATALAGAAAQLSLVTTGPVIGPVGSVFPQPLQAKVVDQFGNAVAGKTVSWSVTAGSATVAPASVVSDAQGLASTTLTFGAAPGTVTVQVAAAGLTNSPASLTATAVASTVTVAAKASPSGDAQSGTVGQELANPLRIVVTRAGVPEPGAVVTWHTAATGAAFTPSASVTDNSGIATTRWMLGQAAGTETAQADLAGGVGVTFSATALAGAAAQLSLVTTGPVIGPVGSVFPQPLQARVVDQFGNAVTGTTVSWSVTAGSAAVSPASVVSNAQGLASTTLTFGAAPGTVTLQAAAAGLTNSPVSLSATAVAVATTATVQLLEAGGNRFSPTVLTVAAGTTVTFEWVGGFHDVNSFGSSTFPSSIPAVSAPHSQQVTFTQPGTYQYFCSIHGSTTGGMRGTIVVQ